jgi:dihydroorotase-like cyclic amidohydrolase
VGQKADLTIFDAESTLIFNNNNLSKGVNHPLKGKELKGVVLGTVLNGTWNPVNVSAAGV